MPHHFDFSQFEKIEETSIDVIGWNSPLLIEYSYANEVNDTKLFWRIKGTSHTFTIYVSELNRLSNGDYKNHFQQALTVFREDILEWIASGLQEKWMREYVYMYQKFIQI